MQLNSSIFFCVIVERLVFFSLSASTTGFALLILPRLLLSSSSSPLLLSAVEGRRKKRNSVQNADEIPRLTVLPFSIPLIPPANAITTALLCAKAKVSKIFRGLYIFSTTIQIRPSTMHAFPYYSRVHCIAVQKGKCN